MDTTARQATERAGTTLLDRPILRIRDVSVGFGAKTVLSGIDLDIQRGSINALIGPTGCGKSTLLRSLNRMNDKVRGYWRHGAIELEDVDVASHDTDPLVLRRRVGMVFQRPNPFPMSIRDNVVAGVRAHGMFPRAELPNVAERYLKEVGLWAAVADRMNDSPFRLSGGQQQLLCLARALAVEPEVLLLDEPTSSLDPVTTEIVEDLLRKLVHSLTIVIVTHNLAQARRVSNTTAFLYNGRLVESGETVRLFDAPTQPETVSYVGGRIG
ncbi:MAG TPA: phosphate ABC transporter ATP-binding protein [Acidimicrobiales bacterium]|nr:phosphate ABC transporter ATP-binding protein [Acidimicrobiales bacterium]